MPYDFGFPMFSSTYNCQPFCTLTHKFDNLDLIYYAEKLLEQITILKINYSILICS